MNHIGYDAMQLGELDLSLDKMDLRNLIEQAEFSVLGSNIDPRDSDDIWDEYVIKKVGGLRIGIFGELRASLLRKEKAIQEDYFANARSIVETLRGKGCDLVICIAHIDDRNAKALPDSVAGIDIVMGGKVAGPMKSEHIVGDSYYINSGDRGRFVGLMQLRLNSEEVIDSVAIHIESLETADPEDPFVKAQVDDFLVHFNSVKKPSAPTASPRKPVSGTTNQLGTTSAAAPQTGLTSTSRKPAAGQRSVAPTLRKQAPPTVGNAKKETE